MLSKTKMSFLTILACISLISIGFATWYIKNDNDSLIYVTGGMYADDVTIIDNGNEYTNNKVVGTLSCGPKGFVDDNGYYVKSGSIEILYTLDLEKCRSIVDSTGDSLEITIVLEFNSNFENINKYNIFGDTNLPVTASVNYNENDITISTSSPENNKYAVKFTLNNILSESNSNDQFTITFTWQLADNIDESNMEYEGNSIANNFWSALNVKNNPKFTLNTTVNRK